MVDIHCADETFDPDFTTEYSLSIQVSLDGFSFCIRDEIRKIHLVFKHHSFQISNDFFLLRKLREILSHEEVLNKPYKKTTIRMSSPRFSAIPAHYDVPEEELFTLNFDRLNKEKILSFTDDFFPVKMVFGFPESIYNLFHVHFDHPEITHQVQTLIRLASQKASSGQSEALLSLNKRFFTLLITRDRKLVFINSFFYKNHVDIIFYILHVFQSEKIGVKETSVFLMGETEEESPLANFLSKRFERVEFLSYTGEYRSSYTFSRFPPHRFLSVIHPGS
jgi:hypothetical protein